MSVHKDLTGFNIACDAEDCAEVNGGVRAHVHFPPDEQNPERSPALAGWILDFAYDEASPRNDFCPECGA